MFLGGDQEVFLGRDFSQSRSNISNEVSRLIDEEIQALLGESYAKATEILTVNRDKLDKLAAILQEREKINEAEFMAVMNGEEFPAASGGENGSASGDDVLSQESSENV